MSLSEKTDSPVPEDYLHDDVQAVSEYRSVSKLAVAALLAGLASLLALLSPGLLGLSLLGVILSLLAIRRIAQSEGELVGRTAAIVGLVLSLAVGAGLLAHRSTVQRLVAQQAGPWALEWCELVKAGDLEVALELTRPSSVRRPFNQELVDFYATDETGRQSFEKFSSNEVVKLLSSAGDDQTLVQGDVVAVIPIGAGGFRVVHDYWLTSADEAADGPGGKKFRIQLDRTSATASIPGAWHVSAYAIPDPTR